MTKTKAKKSNYKDVSLSVIDGLFNANYHPEAINYQKVAVEIKLEFVNYWGKDRNDDLITKEGFIQYFEDVSLAVKDDKSFLDILGSFDYQQKNKL